MEVISLSQAGVRNWAPSRFSDSLIPGKLRICLRPRSLEFNFPVSSKSAKSLFVQRGGASFRKEKCIKIACCRNLQVPVLQARYIVGLAAPPGAGKSTLSQEVVRRVNKLWHQRGPSFDELVEPPEVAVVLPMDGFHLYRHQLDAMEDPKEAHARRGAPWTFDPARLLNCLKHLREHGSVYAPSFDHGVGDPVEDDVFVSLQHKVVIVEGNYLLLGDGIWKDIASLFDEKWFIDIEIDKSMERVLKRHILTGKPPDIAKWRIQYNDRPNAELILKSKTNADLIIRSIDYTN